MAPMKLTALTQRSCIGDCVFIVKQAVVYVNYLNETPCFVSVKDLL